MIVRFSGFETPCRIVEGRPFTLEVHNPVLFAHICESIASGLGRDAVEPYTIWGEPDGEINPASEFLFIGCPLELPWTHRLLAGAIPQVFEKRIKDDYEKRAELEGLFREINSIVYGLGLTLQSDYQFGVDWDLRRYLKAFSYSVALEEDDSLLDKLIKFVLMSKDMSFNKTLVFVNLKLFLTIIELETLFEQVSFSKAKVLLLERMPFGELCRYEEKLVIDQEFFECRLSK